MSLKRYRVTWVMDIEAESPRQAAVLALAIHRDPESIATVFEVCDDDGANSVRIDLNPEHG